MRFSVPILSAALALAPLAEVHAHEIYTGLHGKDGQLCCGGSDCAATVYRMHGQQYELLAREGEWVQIPEERITFLPVPGDNVVSTETHRAHLCYRPATDADRVGHSEDVFGNILLYCAFIAPGAI